MLFFPEMSTFFSGNGYFILRKWTFLIKIENGVLRKQDFMNEFQALLSAMEKGRNERQQQQQQQQASANCQESKTRQERRTFSLD